MAISLPQLVSCSATIDDVLYARSSDDNAAFFVVKNIIGGPVKEIETFTMASVQAALGGPKFFNISPRRFEILDQSFEFLSGLYLNEGSVDRDGVDPIFRFTWNYAGGRILDTILTFDVDVESCQPVSDISQLPFKGLNVNLLDGRFGSNDERIYAIFISGDAVTFHISHDLGETWTVSSCQSCCLFGSSIFYDASVIRDPVGSRESVRVLLRETDPGSTDDAYIIDLSLSQVSARKSKKLYAFFKRPERIDQNGRDAQRFSVIYPLVRRGPDPKEDPC